MTPDTPIWLTEQDVVGLLDLREAIDALETGLREVKADRAVNMGKTHAVWDNGNTLHAIGGVFPGMGYFGTKTWGHTHGGATPLFLLWEAGTGRLAAIIEAFALGQMRTGGISGVATRWMAAPDANELAVIGTGKQALAQVAAVALVRHLRRIRIHSPKPESREAFAKKVTEAGFAAEVVVSGTVADAVADAPIITTVTRAREPFLDGSMIASGAHVNAVGAITPERRELAPSVLERCGLAAADDPQATARLASEFFDYAEKQGGSLRRLADLVGEKSVRPTDGSLTIFKAMGMGISDLSLATEIHKRARKAGVGRAFDHPVRAAPRLGLHDLQKEVAS